MLILIMMYLQATPPPHGSGTVAVDIIKSYKNIQTGLTLTKSIQ
jgi:hypothetical protein